jgi:hypothetical protein
MSITGAPPKLAPNQILALVVLMVEARTVTNNELQELAGFSLVGEQNSKLERLGLIETDRTHRPYSHTLSEKGWYFVRDLHASEAPKEGKSAIRSLYTVLGNVHRALQRLQMSEADFFKQVTADSLGASPNASMVDVELRVRAAYKELSTEPGGWVGLADLREKLSDLDRQDVDDALLKMLPQEGVRIIPVTNSKALKPRDRAAALRIGERDHHTLSIEFE